MAAAPPGILKCVRITCLFSLFPLALFFRHALKSLANKANAAAKPELFGIYSQGHEKLLALDRARIILQAQTFGEEKKKKKGWGAKLSPS